MTADLDERIRLDRLRDLFGQPGLPGYATAAMFCGLAVETAVVAWTISGVPLAFGWAAAMLPLEVGLACYSQAFHRKPRNAPDVRRWGRWKVWQEGGHGFAWSLCVPFVHWGNGDIGLLAATVTLIGLTAAAVPGYAVHPPASVAFVSAALLPAAAYLHLAIGDRPASYAAAMLFVAFLLAIANAWRWTAIYRDTTRIRLELAASGEERRRLLDAAESARQAAEAAAAERTRFLGAASHDLRQPVHALGFFAALLNDDPPARERRLLIDRVVSCIASLEQLFEAILGLAPSDEERVRQSFDVGRVVERVALQFRPQVEERALELTVRAAPAWVEGDPAATERIVANLLSNAIRYTKQGRIDLSVRPRRKGVDLYVVDTGMGFETAVRERIFDPFYRLPAARATGDHGFGLGLSIVSELCRANGFAINLRSTPGRGSLFRVSFRRAEPLPSESIDEPPAALAPRHILLVEDDPLAVDAVTRLLVGWGMTVEACADGPQALTILAADVGVRWHVILDQRLGGEESGLEIAGVIRERFGERATLTLLTGESDPAIFAAAARQGLAVMRKPVTPMRLRARLAAG